jgi:hypothetical protein
MLFSLSSILCFAGFWPQTGTSSQQAFHSKGATHGVYQEGSEAKAVSKPAQEEVWVLHYFLISQGWTMNVFTRDQKEPENGLYFRAAFRSLSGGHPRMFRYSNECRVYLVTWPYSRKCYYIIHALPATCYNSHQMRFFCDIRLGASTTFLCFMCQFLGFKSVNWVMYS